jgi:hypothetical protein
MLKGIKVRAEGRGGAARPEHPSVAARALHGPAEDPGRGCVRSGRGRSQKTYTRGDAIPIHRRGEAGATEIASARSRSIAGPSEGLITRAIVAPDLAHVGS